MQELSLIVILIAVAWYWWDATRTSERAFNVCQKLCRNAELQLLDNAVVQQRIWLGRGAGGGVQLCRIYSFDYSDDNESRRQGYIVMLGQHVAEASMDPRHVTGRTIEGSTE